VKVLVVDDSASIRTRLVAMLGEVVGVDEVLEADAFAPALAMARASSPSVIVLDLNLGQENGIALLPLLKREHVGAVVIVLTNHASDAHRRQCEASGASFFFDKSNDFARVVEIVTAMSERGRA
jgi:DNA-binding NarL/FixJ family response regulator